MTETELHRFGAGRGLWVLRAKLRDGQGSAGCGQTGQSTPSQDPLTVLSLAPLSRQLFTCRMLTEYPCPLDSSNPTFHSLAALTLLPLVQEDVTTRGGILKSQTQAF